MKSTAFMRHCGVMSTALCAARCTTPWRKHRSTAPSACIRVIEQKSLAPTVTADATEAEWRREPSVAVRSCSANEAGTGESIWHEPSSYLRLLTDVCEHANSKNQTEGSFCTLPGQPAKPAGL
jgi:hypothetical protein